MTSKNDDEESDILNAMFEEIVKMVNEKQIKLESIIQRMTEQDKLSKDTFSRIYNSLTDHGKKKRWL